MNIRQEMMCSVGILLCGILFPYIMTLLLMRDGATFVQAVDSGYYITFGDTESMDAEDYLIGALAAQMPAAWEEEALKAQAILLRTKLYSAMNGTTTLASESTGMEYWSVSQMNTVWGSEIFSSNYKKLYRVLEQTRGLVLMYEGSLAQGLYHYASCGVTREDISGNYPYLKSVDSEWDLEAEGYLQIQLFTEEEFAQCINQIDEQRQVSAQGIRESIQMISQDSSGYILRLQIGGCEFQGVEVANALALSSTCITFQSYEARLRVIAKGVGHGYGMSQWGANKLAQKGKTAQDILLYYFPNTLVQTLDSSTI